MFLVTLFLYLQRYCQDVEIAKKFSSFKVIIMEVVVFQMYHRAINIKYKIKLLQILHLS